MTEVHGFTCVSVNVITAFIIEANHFVVVVVVVASGFGYINKVTVMFWQLRRLTG